MSDVEEAYIPGGNLLTFHVRVAGAAGRGYMASEVGTPREFGKDIPQRFEMQLCVCEPRDTTRDDVDAALRNVCGANEEDNVVVKLRLRPHRKGAVEVLNFVREGNRHWVVPYKIERPLDGDELPFEVLVQNEHTARLSDAVCIFKNAIPARMMHFEDPDAPAPPERLKELLMGLLNAFAQPSLWREMNTNGTWRRVELREVDDEDAFIVKIGLDAKHLPAQFVMPGPQRADSGPGDCLRLRSNGVRVGVFPNAARRQRVVFDNNWDVEVLFETDTMLTVEVRLDEHIAGSPTLAKWFYALWHE